MASPTKVLLTLAAIIVAGLLLLVGGAWFWWDQNGSDLLDAGKTAMEEGQRSGSELTETSCMSTAIDRHKADTNRSFGSALRNSLWLSGCLNASRPQEQFCVGVPASDEILTMAMWSTQMCAKNGIDDPTCPNLMQSVSNYCASPQREEKLRGGAPPARERGVRPIA